MDKESMKIGINLNNFNSSYGISRIPTAPAEDIKLKKQAELAGSDAGSLTKEQKGETPGAGINTASRMAKLEDVSLTFNKEDSFDNIGADADIRGLDMTKAISNMKRDSILADYQTFVGPTSEQIIAGLEDGVVVIK